MKRTGTARAAAMGATRTGGPSQGVSETPLGGIGWERYVGVGMTPEMQALYRAAREKRQVR